MNKLPRFFFLLAIAFLGLITTAFAQGFPGGGGFGGPPGGFPGQMTATADDLAKEQTKQLTKRLKLDKETSEKVYTLTLDRYKQTQALTAGNNNNPNPNVVLAKTKEIQAKYDEQLKPLVPADKWSTYEKYRDKQLKVEAMNANRSNGGGGFGGPPGGGPF